MKKQSVRGTRDFYPADMAVRSWLTEVWRRVSRRAGFVEVDGPELEPLELYTEKSGPEIAEQLYWLEDKGGRKLALRPEFTPTLARMIAARQAALPVPIRWFNVSRCFRYERAQKGRLREFFQWNVDLVGVEGEVADAECIAVAVESLMALGLRPGDAVVRVSDRRLLGALVKHLGIAEARVPGVFAALDRRDKVSADALAAMLTDAGLKSAQREGLGRILAWQRLEDIDERELATPEVRESAEALGRLFGLLDDYGLAEWCVFDIGIVRGLAYYTGPVWEVHDGRGELRSVFGGGRYDRLLGELGAQPMPACGFGCGDAVLGILLAERGLGPADGGVCTCYVLSRTESLKEVLAVVTKLRRLGVETEFDLQQGGFNKQHKRAVASGARFKVIIGEEPWPKVRVIDTHPPDGGPATSSDLDIVKVSERELGTLFGA